VRHFAKVHVPSTSNVHLALFTLALQDRSLDKSLPSSPTLLTAETIPPIRPPDKAREQVYPTSRPNRIWLSRSCRMLNYEGDSGCHAKGRKTWRERAEGIPRRRQWVDLIHCMPRIYGGASPQRNFSLSDSLEILETSRRRAYSLARVFSTLRGAPGRSVHMACVHDSKPCKHIHIFIDTSCTHAVSRTDAQFRLGDRFLDEGFGKILRERP
jgi:hypothetical protein